ncbi:MAG: leucine-rich repeat domain-containing protein [Bacteroidaceae bacterium]|nr:leucine-rich repeat domain-containing protein [Bacteroidaceae bacterium]
MNKRIKLLFLALCMTPLVASAANVTWNENGFYFSADDTGNTCAVTGTSNSGDVVIPSTSTYNGVEYIVDRISSWFIKGHTIPRNLTTISSVTIPATVENIATGAFGLSQSITEMRVEEDNTYYCAVDGVLYNKSMTSIVYWPAKKEVGDYVVPSTIKVLSGEAFSNNQTLTSITIPSSITSLSNGASIRGNTVGTFAGCNNLKTVNFEEGSTLTEIPSYCFSSCKSLNEINLPNTIKKIGSYAFNGCSSLNIPMPPYLETIGIAAFQSCSSMTEVIFPSTMKSVESTAFNYCPKIKKVVIPEDCDVTIIPENCFRMNYLLEEVSLSNKITSIQSSAFAYCYKLPEIDLPTELQTIGTMAFYNGSILKNVTFHDKLKTIGDGAFSKCVELKQINLPQSLQTIGAGAFMEVAAETLTIPASVTTIRGGAFAMTANMTEFIVEDGNTAYTTVEGVLFTKDMKTLLSYPAASVRDVSYTVPAGVTIIQEGAFSKARLTHITLPSSLTTIYNGAFAFNTNLTELTIPEAVTSIGLTYSADNIDYTLTRINIIYETNVNSLFVLNAETPPVIRSTTADKRAWVIPNRTNNITYGAQFPVVYMKKTAYDNNVYQRANQWSLMSDFAYEIPVTLPSSGMKTMGRDFDVDLSSSDMKAYVCVSTEQTGDSQSANMEPIAVAGKGTGEYVPSRTGQHTINGIPYETYVGVILKGDGGASSTYRIGESEDATTSQTNYLMAATDARTVNMTETKDGTAYTNLGLNSGLFKYFTTNGTLAYNKCWLSVPTSVVGTYETTSGAKAFSLSFLDEEEATSISQTPTQEAANGKKQPYYTLQGVRTDRPQRGIYIHQGKKVIIK